MSGLWREVLTSLATVAMIATVWGIVRDHVAHRGLAERAALFGLVFGLGGAGLVALAGEAPFDGQPFYGLAAVVGYFAGAAPALVAAGLILAADAVVFQPHVPLALGLAGAVVLAGVYIGRRRAGGAAPLPHIAGLAVVATAASGLAVAAAGLVDTGAADAAAAGRAGLVALPATLIAALLVRRDRQRRRSERTGLVLGLAVETMPDAVSIKDVSGRFILANPATAALFGAASAEELIGRTDADFLPADLAARHRTDEAATLAARRPLRMEQSVVRRCGDVEWLMTLKAPVVSPSGDLIGIITHNRDITEHKRLERALAESRQRLDDALTLMPQGLVMFDADNHIVYCNERYSRLFPLTADLRRPGTGVVDLLRAVAERGEGFRLPPDTDLDAWAEETARQLRREGSRTFEINDGRHFESFVRATADGGCHMVVSDITERKRAEARLSEAEARWNFALESAGQGVWDFDLSTGRTYHSPTWKAMLGYGPDELPDASTLWLDLMHPDDRPAAMRANDDHLAGRTPIFAAEFRLRHKDGRWIWILDRGKVIEFDAEGRAVRAIGTHTDITASKESDAAIRASEARFRSLFELSPVGLALVDVGSGRLVTRSPSLAEMLGRDPDDDAALALADILADPAALPLAGLAEAGRLAPVECDIRRADGAALPVIVTGSSVTVQDGSAQVMLVFQDISMRRGYEERLWRLANIDGLTGLPNRMQFNARLADAMERSRRTGQPFAVAFFDLDNFKDVNDSFGHGAGDELLAETARRVRRALRATDTLARFGGDEFAALIEGFGDGDDLARPLEAVIAAINQPIDLAGAPRRFSTSIGVALFPADAGDADELMKNADIALYRAKQTGRNRFEFFRPELRRAIDHRTRLLGEVETALSGNGVELSFEPVVAGHGSRCSGLAVLPTLSDAAGRPLSEAHMAAALSDANIAQTIGRLTRWRAIAAAAAWRRAGLGFGRLAFDLLPADLRTDHFVDDLTAHLSQERLEASSISLRVTSSALTARGGERIAPMLLRLHDLGVQLVLANFGAGQTSLDLLRDLPFDWVSFDSRMIARLESSPTDQAIVIGLIDLVHRLGIAAGGAGVATVFQADFLIGLGCEYLHGPLFSAPLDAEATRHYLDRFGGFVDDLDHVDGLDDDPAPVPRPRLPRNAVA